MKLKKRLSKLALEVVGILIALFIGLCMIEEFKGLY